MIMDKNLMVSAAQAVTASAASTNYIDLGAAGDAYVSSWLVVQVREAATASGSATVDIDIQCDDNTSFSSATSLYKVSAVPKATLVANYEAIKVRIPQGCERYLRVYYTVATGPLTAGTFDAFVVSDVKTGSQ
jgi:hypothetical protein